MKKILYIFLIAVVVASCARMGSPDGGWYDDDPPRVLYSTPAEQATNVKQKKMTIYFDEFIKLADPTQNVIVSPPQLEMPEIKATGRKIVIELQDTLIPNTTYTVDFSDAISDNNEGNPMGNYTYTFSTGEQIDTFEVAGNVLDASNLEPVKGISVGLYADLADSAFRTKPLLRIARTDGRGRFCIRGVAPGEYRVYALQDMDANFMFSQKSEMIAFSHQTYKPTAGPDIRQDTIWRDSLHIDNILQVPYTHFYPDDIVMLAFQEVQTDRYLLKTERKEPDRIGVYFSYGNKQLPILRGLNFDADSAFILESTPKQDTLTYWLRDTMLVNKDTLELSMEYLMTDTLGKLVTQIDTLELVAKTPYAKRLKQKQKEFEEWQKEQEKKKKRDQPYDSIYPVQPLKPDIRIPSTMVPDEKVRIEMPNPLVRCDTSAIHLYSQIDSLWYEAAYVFKPVEGTIREFEITAEWRPDTEYSLEIDSAAFENIYGQVSDKYKQGIKVKKLDELGTLTLNLSGVTDTIPLRVQLLNSSGGVVKEIVAKNNVAHFDYVTPNKYYVSAFLDANNNGQWDTGDYDADLQPEDVFYYNREIECKEKWDITQAWNLTGTPRFKQKPRAITKQKPEAEKKLKNRNADRAKKLGIPYNKDKIVKVKKQDNEKDE